MGSLTSSLSDEEGLEKWNRDLEFINTEGERILNLSPNSQDFKDLVWLVRNKERILRNRKLIELLG